MAFGRKKARISATKRPSEKSLAMFLFGLDRGI
jgi:hypothetical protein